MSPRFSYERIERLTETLLDRHRVARPPVDIDWIAEQEGLRFSYVDLRTVSGVYHRETARTGIAFISESEPKVRQRFSKGHELAHHVLDEPAVTTMLGHDYLTAPSGYRGRGRHWAHEYFAGCLLMPRGWVADVARHGSWSHIEDMVNEVARTFHVSRAAAEIRLEQLGHKERRRRD